MNAKLMKKIVIIGTALFGFNQMSVAETLLYVNPSSAKSCDAKTLTLPTKKEQVLFSESTCPILLNWDYANEQFLYVHQHEVVLRTKQGIQNLGRPKLLKKEGLDVDSYSADLWIDQTTQRPHIVFLVNVNEKQIKKTGKGEQQKKFIMFDGKQYDASSLGLSSNTLAMAVMYEWQGTAWKQVAIKPTEIEAEGALGLNALQAYRERKVMGVSFSNTVNQTICASNHSLLACEGEQSGNNSIPKTLFQISEDGMNGAGEVLGFKEGRVLFATIFGDSMHAQAPVYFCEDKACQKTKKLNKIDDQQLGLAKIGAWLLVMEEYNHSNPRLYQLNQPNPIWSAPKGKLIGWKP